jgi:adenosylhomocysteine nucleosidase
MAGDSQLISVPTCDILIFTAVPSEEKALRQVAQELGFTYAKLKTESFEYRDLGMVGVNRVLAVETEMGPFGFDGAAARAIYAKIATGAQGLVGLGMAFGIDRKTQSIGDVVVSTSILTYDDRR